MFYKTILAFVCCCYWLVPIFSQDCGVTDLNQKTWMPKYLEHIKGKESNSIRDTEYKVPIVLHLVAKDNGAGRARLATALTMLCELNIQYAPANISFYLVDEGINFINHDGIFNGNNFTINQMAMESIRLDSALNVFIVNSVGSNGVVGFYDNTRDWVILQKNVFVSGNKTLAHEIGHLFALFHPHFGWDAMAWDSVIHGNPCSEIASDGQTLTEKMDGSNCTIAGDLLCDTAPDYNFGIDWHSSCNYEGGALDPDHTLVDPDETLIMSYFDDDCRQTFSEEQIEIMQLDLDHSTRAHLHPNYIPGANPISSSPIVVYPEGLVSIENNLLDFEWETISEADYYYIEYDRSPDFDLDPKGLITTYTSVSIEHDWLQDYNYYWRVFAWNESDFCTAPSLTQQFSLDIMSSIHEEARDDADSSIDIFVSSGKIVIAYQLEVAQDYKLNMYNLKGMSFFSKTLNLPSGKGVYYVDLPDIPKGIFVASMNGEIVKNQLVVFP